MCCQVIFINETVDLSISILRLSWFLLTRILYQSFHRGPDSINALDDDAFIIILLGNFSLQSYQMAFIRIELKLQLNLECVCR